LLSHETKEDCVALTTATALT